MLVAISGSQGSGKSTIIKNIEAQGFNVITRKTSRSILDEWGVTLEEVNADPDLTLKFQEAIIVRKHNDELEASLNDELWFTERTMADLFTYALITLGKHNQYSDWLDRYYERCMRFNQYYTAVFYLRAGHFNIEHDGTRGSNQHYSRMADLTMLDLTQQMTHSSRLTIIETPDIKQRMSIIRFQSVGGLPDPMQFRNYMDTTEQEV